MAAVSLSTIKNWFKTGLKPTQAQFWDTWDSFWHKLEGIPTSAVTGLDDLISDLPTQEQVAILNQLQPITANVGGTSLGIGVSAGSLVEVVAITAASSGAVKIGTTSNGSEIIEDYVTAGTPAVFRIDYFFSGAGTLYLTGTFTAKIFLR